MLSRRAAIFSAAGLALVGDRAWSQAPDPLRLETQDGPLVIVPIKHGSVVFTFKDKYYYVDPAQLPKGERRVKADAIFITHEHGDHYDPAALAELRKEGTVIIANPRVVELMGMGQVMKNGDKRDVLDVQVEAVPAYNIERKQFHPQGRDNGYVFTVGGKRIYLAGDTEGTPEMKALKNIDVAFLPINLPYTMPPKDAAEAARAFRPKLLVPYHQGQANPQEVADALKDTDIKVLVLKLP